MGLGEYIKETRGELKHVSWPTRSQALVYSAVVIVLSLGLAAFLGAFDYLFSHGLQYFINHF